MSAVDELIRSEADGTISFGNYTLGAKSKQDNFQHAGDSYKVKTFKEITKLERNGMFAYESVPGTAVSEMDVTEAGMEFQVEGFEDAEITLGLDEESAYEVMINGAKVGEMTTNLGGKLTISVELGDAPAKVKVAKIAE